MAEEVEPPASTASHGADRRPENASRVGGYFDLAAAELDAAFAEGEWDAQQRAVLETIKELSASSTSIRRPGTAEGDPESETDRPLSGQEQAIVERLPSPAANGGGMIFLTAARFEDAAELIAVDGAMDGLGSATAVPELALGAYHAFDLGAAPAAEGVAAPPAKSSAGGDCSRANDDRGHRSLGIVGLVAAGGISARLYRSKRRRQPEAQ